MYVAVLEPRCRGAKDEIDVTGNVAVLKVLPATIYQNCVLPPKKPTFAKYDPVTFDSNRERLPDRARRIFKREVLNREIVSIDECRGRAKCSDRFAVRAD